MNALLLPGMSPRHREWIRQLAEAIKPHFGEVRFLDYAHWDTPGAEMDLEREIHQAAELAKDLGEYVVIAKSIGTVLTTLGTARGMLAPQACVFLGFPLNVVHDLLEAGELAEALKQLPPTAFVHNQNDPLGTADEVRAYLAKNAPAKYEIIPTPGDTHDYVDFNQMIQLASAQ